ncbi:UDP-N-acetylglucosamine 2-epimerase (non-hydrolyzing) [Sediminicoccus sp. KRV36]|uniref:non-hydrolyzing UDP-N-acetylglucosamine 2-epimerase n=1 Tax=Sediminicoccus sp. KRV36 TaxID=3133721 RepID=UPI00200CEDCC|nr:UDP-N-acetylglucosamine 2-epimerase (non-hydrolyzing) [Sediminicoccus rosea]UPY37119.1 UDP-N-acetylglucosamine 2-epimerase (non-hydrolyzing) [Sediminicoccus rosea]
MGFCVFDTKLDRWPISISDIFCILGTRPEAVKMAPVIHALRDQPWARVTVVSTGQHRDMIGQMLGIFGIRPDRELEVMQPGQSLAELTARILQQLDPVLAEQQPALVLAQGDTTTVLASAMASFYRRIPFGHVEAGLRTHDPGYPFPEEFNRVLAARIAAIHFAPSMGARANLLREGIAPGLIHVTGNPVIDALLDVAARPEPALPYPSQPGRRMILLTMHRRENTGENLRNICQAICALHARFPDVEFVYPMHPNPALRQVVQPMLGSLGRVHLIEAVDYPRMTGLLKNCHLVLTDSGGLQEEAPALGKPVLVLRAETERPELVEAGFVRLIGTQTDTILEAVSRFLDDPAAGGGFARGTSPYGDGKAGPRIAQLCGVFLGQLAAD